jgi:hypothetical protein
MRQHELSIITTAMCLALSACASDSGDSGVAQDAEAITWNKDIAPLVADKCLTCHVAGGIAPFSMESYAQAKPFAAQMAQAVEDGRMPPFLARETDACQPRLPWQNDLRLAAHDTELVRKWADAHAPEGTGKAETPTAGSQTAALNREDVSMNLPEPITVSGADDVHTCLLLDPGIDHDGYVIGRYLHPGNQAVLHHVVSYLVTPGKNADGSDRSKQQLEAAIRAERNIGIGERYDCFGGPGLTSVSFEMLDAWAPGGLPNLAPADSGQPIDKDALVLLDMHYHPTGGADQVDNDTRLSLMLSQERPTYISKILLLGNITKHRESGSGVGELLRQPDEDQAEFLIPAGAADHVEEMTWQWKFPAGADMRMYATGTHMHYVGRDMRISVERAEPTDDDPSDECFIETPDWNFNWQRAYNYDAEREQLPRLQTGDTMHLRCSYDNTLDNAFLATALGARGLDAPMPVELGESTLDEMCIGMVGLEYQNTNP